MPDCHFVFVYDAGRAIGAVRLEAIACIVLEFFERRDLFLVGRESGIAFPRGRSGKFAVVGSAPAKNEPARAGGSTRRGRRIFGGVMRSST